MTAYPFVGKPDVTGPLQDFGCKVIVTDFALARWQATCQGVDLENLPKKPTSTENNFKDGQKYEQVVKWYDDTVRNYYMKYSNK